MTVAGLTALSVDTQDEHSYPELPGQLGHQVVARVLLRTASTGLSSIMVTCL